MVSFSRRFDIIHKPLTLTVTLEPSGSVTTKQQFNAMAWDEEEAAYYAEYVPDYTVTPCSLFPQVSIFDPDGALTSGSANSRLYNIKWYKIVGGVRTQILDTTEGYTITTSGSRAGELAIGVNLDPKTSATYEFNAEFLDTRTNQIHYIQQSYLMVCRDVTEGTPEVRLDTPELTLWNPLVDDDEKTVSASLWLNGQEVPSQYRAFVWEVLRSNGAWTTVGTDNSDSDITASSDGVSVVVNRRLMGDDIQFRCRVKYSTAGTPSSVALTLAAPTAGARMKRYIPKYDPSYGGVPSNIPPGTSYIYPEARVKFSKYEASNWEDELVATWHMATNKTSGSLTYTQIAEGKSPEIPTSLISQSVGGVLELRVEDRGAWGAWADADGSALTDAGGAVLMLH